MAGLALIILLLPAVIAKPTGFSFSKLRSQETHAANGHSETNAKAEESVADLSGKVLSKVAQTGHSVDGGAPDVKTAVEVKREAEAPPSEEELAEWIAGSATPDELVERLAELVGHKLITAEDADQIWDSVDAEVEKTKGAAPPPPPAPVTPEDDAELKDAQTLVTLTQKLAEEDATRGQLFDLLRRLYVQYKNGDEKSRDLLSEFTDTVEQSAGEGHISKDFESNILETVLKAMEEVDGETKEDTAVASLHNLKA